MIKVNIHEAKTTLSKLLAVVEEKGEQVLKNIRTCDTCCPTPSNNCLAAHHENAA